MIVNGYSGGRESGVVLVPNNSMAVCGQSTDTFSRDFPLSPPSCYSAVAVTAFVRPSHITMTLSTCSALGCKGQASSPCWQHCKEKDWRNIQPTKGEGEGTLEEGGWATSPY